MTTVIFFFMAELSVGQSAAASLAETTSAFAPFVIAAWMAGICDAAVAAVPLVSVPVSPRAFRAASAPPDLALSEVVKYGLPRFFGITKTFSPFFRGAAEADAIAAGTPTTSASPSSVTTQVRLFIDFLMT